MGPGDLALESGEARAPASRPVTVAGGLSAHEWMPRGA